MIGKPLSTQFFFNVSKLILTLVLVLCCSFAAEAQLTWIGGNGGSWGVGANWDPNGTVPQSIEDVTINTGEAIVGSGIVATSRALIVGDTSSAALRIENGGALTSRDFAIGHQISAAGTVTVNAASWNILGTPIAVGLEGNGTLNIQAGATVDADGEVTVAEEAGSVGELTIEGNSSELIARGGVTVGNPDSSSSGTLNIRNNGTLTGDPTRFPTLTVNGPGKANVETAGSIILDLVSVESGAELNNHGTISSLFDPSFSFLSNSGKLTGSGVQNHALLDDGILAPTAASSGDPTGGYTINGDWDQGIGAELQIDLGGLSDAGGNPQSTAYDWVDVGGDVTLAGGIDASLVSGFNPGLGVEFEIIRVGGTLNGTFAGLSEGSIVAVLDGMPIHVSYQNNKVTLYTPTGFEADFDSDNDVDGDDLDQWEGDYGLNGFSDANGDGDSTSLDFFVWQRQSGYGVASLAANVTVVPEPASWISGMLIPLSLMLVRSRVTFPHS